jgi:chemotaxis protein MotB
MGSSEKVKKAVAGYFNDPKGTGSMLGTTMTGTGEAITVQANDQMQKLKEKLEAEIKAKKELQKLSKQIEITITAEGLRIELIEDKNGTFYQSGSAHISDIGQELLGLLAGELKTLPNELLIEGHTDATQYSTDTNYSNWELSADRANSARRLLQENGVRSDQVTQVRGYADMMLRVKSNPHDPSNRRISLLVKNGADGAAPPNISGDGKKAIAGPAPASASPSAAVKGAPIEAKPQTATAAAGAAVVPAIAPSAAPAAKAQTVAKAAAAKPAAGTPAAKPGLMARLKSMLPGGKK